MKVPSMDTLYNNEFSHTAPSEDDIPRAIPMRLLLPATHLFGFSDYLPDNYYDHLQPQFDPPFLSQRKEDS
uniref:Uncharacterized protein n=1 Tax=Romanomermis culicivorax TaxID=13658 RepID=A0A915JKU6_ROMCU